jgi:hypothetical protein
VWLIANHVGKVLDLGQDLAVTAAPAQLGAP